MRRCVLLPLTVAALVFSGGCGDDSDTDDAGPVDDVRALAENLDEVGDGCTLEYEGLADEQREVSICTLGSGTAELSVWTDAEALASVVEAAEQSGAQIVVGVNWTIDVTDESLVDDVADATGGEVRP